MSTKTENENTISTRRERINFWRQEAIADLEKTAGETFGFKWQNDFAGAVVIITEIQRLQKMTDEEFMTEEKEREEKEADWEDSVH